MKGKQSSNIISMRVSTHTYSARLIAAMKQLVT
jgi:hypothetical protein